MSPSGGVFVHLKQEQSSFWFSRHISPLSVFCVSLLIFSLQVFCVAPHRRVQSFSSNIGSDPNSRCCLSAESTHVWHPALGFVQICANLLELSRTDSDLWPLMCKPHTCHTYESILWVWIEMNWITANQWLHNLTGATDYWFQQISIHMDGEKRNSKW